MRYLHLERATILIEIPAVFFAAFGVCKTADLLCQISKPRWNGFVEGSVILSILLFLALDPTHVYLQNANQIRAQIRSNQALDLPLIQKAGQSDGYFWSRYLSTEKPSERLVLGEIPYCYVASHFKLPQLVRRTHTMTFPSQTLYLFDYHEATQYRLFNIATIGELKKASLKLPFLKKIYESNEHVLWKSPSPGWFEPIGISKVEVIAEKNSYLEKIQSWLSKNPSAQIYPAFVPEAIARQWPFIIPRERQELPSATVLYQKQSLNRFEAKILSRAPGFAVLKTAFHPRWEIRKNGELVNARWVGLGVMAFPIDAGINEVLFTFPSDQIRSLLFGVSIFSYLVGFFWLAYSIKRVRRRRLPFF